MKLFSKYRTSFIFIVLFFFHQAPAAHMILNAPVVTQTLQYCATGFGFLFAYFKHQNQTSSPCTTKTDNHDNKPFVPNVVINNNNRTNVRYYVNPTDIPPGYIAQYVPIDNQGNFRYMIEEPSPDDSIRCHCGCCTTFDCGCKCGCGCDKPTKKQSLDDILKKCIPGKVTKGKTRQFEKPGDFSQALRDFDSLNLSNIKNLENGKKMGSLPDGKLVIVRPTSKGKLPTLEIQFLNSAIKIKIRYIK